MNKRLIVFVLVLLLPLFAAGPAAPAPDLQLRWLLPQNTAAIYLCHFCLSP